MTNKRSKLSIALPTIIAVSILLGIFLSKIFNNDIGVQPLLSSSKTNKLSVILDYIENEYVDEISIEELTESAIPKILKDLDPHSVYFSAKEAKAAEEELYGQFDGIGVQFNIFKDTVLVVNVIEGGPSEKYGIEAGDRIVAVDDSVIAGIGIKNSQVMSLLKGKKNSVVNLKIFRRSTNEFIDFKVNRGSIPLKSVDAFYRINQQIAYVKISSFSSATHAQFADAVEIMDYDGDLESIILDLRGNSGGYMVAATDIVDEFLESGKLIDYTEGKSRPQRSVLATRNLNACQDLDIIVLIDDFSASASEIVAGAIQDNDRGIVIGRRSYGKGLVQEPTNFNDGSTMRLTTARYYTPSGRCIQKPYDNGTEEYYLDIYNRYIHGEFAEKDSIQNIDSLIYFTTNGRSVFGGGGIMPDIFVPIDTSGYSKLFEEIRQKNLDYIFATEYIDDNRNQLSKIDKLGDLKTFLLNDNVYNKFWNYVHQKGVYQTNKDMMISGKYIERNVMSYIIRQVLDENNFYKYINSDDPVVDSALNVISNRRINSILSQNINKK